MRHLTISAVLALAATASHASDPVEAEKALEQTAPVAAEAAAAAKLEPAVAKATESKSAKAARDRDLVPSNYDPDKSVRICREQTRTGSRLPKKRCKTAAQMKREAAYRKDQLHRNSSRIPRTQPAFKFPDK